ncbi:MAG: D-alanyl-D-alanine carboxypeptidase [Bacteroidota bacterium]
MRPIVFLFCLSVTLVGLFSSCATQRLITNKERKTLHQQISESAVFNRGFTGFQLYDPTSKTVVYERYADRYFTPASTTKIITYYAASRLLGDSIPTFRYVNRGDSLLFWGTGDPTLFHPHFDQNPAIQRLLNQSEHPLFYSTQHFQQDRYGAGWMWDDYPYYFQVELAPMPIYGNYIRVQGAPESRSFSITPSYFTNRVNNTPELGGRTARFYRQLDQNLIDYNEQPVGKKELDRALPFIYSDTLFLTLLKDSIQRPVQLLTDVALPSNGYQTIHNVPKDTVLRRIMFQSDNFLAEQMVLLCGHELTDTLQTNLAIRRIVDSLFTDSPDPLKWRDGSGLSRYNQFTPRTLVYVLEKIYRDLPATVWKRDFSVGGSGRSFQPYLFGKTGSMSQVRCYGGFVETQSGKTLIFSFMNSNLPTGHSPWNEEIDKVLRWVHQNL